MKSSQEKTDYLDFGAGANYFGRKSSAKENYSVLREYTLSPHLTNGAFKWAPHMLCKGREYSLGELNNYPSANNNRVVCLNMLLTFKLENKASLVF